MAEDADEFSLFDAEGGVFKDGERATRAIGTRLSQAVTAAIKKAAAEVKGADIGVFPPYPYIAFVKEALSTTEVAVGGQDLYFEKKGAFTGQVSGAMLKDVGAPSVIGMMTSLNAPRCGLNMAATDALAASRFATFVRPVISAWSAATTTSKILT